MYGYGDVGRGNTRLIADIRALAGHPERLPALGDFSRQFVVQHFSLEPLGALLAHYCKTAVADVRPLSVTP